MQNELELRISRIQKRMREDRIDGCLISTNMNLYYVLGHLIGGYVYVQQEGVPICFVKRSDEFISDSSFSIRKPEQIPPILKSEGIAFPKRLWVESEEISHEEWLRYQSIFSESELLNSTTELRKIRSVKSSFELELVREGGRLQSDAYTSFPSLYKEGMSDNDFSIEMEREMRRRGNLGIVRVFGQTMEIFFGTVLSGSNAKSPSVYDFALGGEGLHPSIPVGQNGTVPRQGQTFMVDICGNFNGYHVDQTRIFSVGRTTEKAYSAHQVSLEIHRMFEEEARPGVACEYLFEKAWSIARHHHLESCFMGSVQQARFVGHGIGLVLNELPVICGKNKMLLKAGMTIAWEPKFIVDGVGAVGNENTFIITESGNAERVTTADESIVSLC